MKSLILTLFIALLPVLVISQAGMGEDWRVGLKALNQGDMIELIPVCKAPCSQTILYEVKVSRRTQNGSSSQSSQSGRIKAIVGEDICLCRMRLNLEPEDEFSLTIIIYSIDGEILTQRQFSELAF